MLPKWQALNGRNQPNKKSYVLALILAVVKSTNEGEFLKKKTCDPFDWWWSWGCLCHRMRRGGVEAFHALLFVLDAYMYWDTLLCIRKQNRLASNGLWELDSYRYFKWNRESSISCYFYTLSVFRLISVHKPELPINRPILRENAERVRYPMK